VSGPARRIGTSHTSAGMSEVGAWPGRTMLRRCLRCAAPRPPFQHTPASGHFLLGGTHKMNYGLNPLRLTLTAVRYKRQHYLISFQANGSVLCSETLRAEVYITDVWCVRLTIFGLIRHKTRSCRCVGQRAQGSHTALLQREACSGDCCCLTL